MKTTPPKISKAKKTTLKQKPKVIKTQPPAPKIEPKKVPKTAVVLRKTPATLSKEQVKAMLVEKGFYDRNLNSDGKGITHNYVKQTIHSDKVVLDKATGLMWQRSGSPDGMTYDAAGKYIRDLNVQRFAGYNDWRLPTLEEAMSLIEPKELGEYSLSVRGKLYLDPVFDREQSWIWTEDKFSAGAAWVVGFGNGGCDDRVLSACVRAVR